MKLRHWAVVGFITACGVSLAWAANNYPLPTAGGTRTTFKSTDNAGVHTPHVNVDTVTTSGITSQYPVGATPETASATGTTGATAATLATAVGKTTYICGFSIRANATAAATGNATVAGTITGTLNFTQWTAPLASGIGVTEQRFGPCVPASVTNTTIVVTGPAPGSGGVISVSAWGYQL
jgi:hypothetical protein